MTHSRIMACMLGILLFALCLYIVSNYTLGKRLQASQSALADAAVQLQVMRAEAGICRDMMSAPGEAVLQIKIARPTYVRGSTRRMGGIPKR